MMHSIRITNLYLQEFNKKHVVRVVAYLKFAFQLVDSIDLTIYLGS